MVYFVVFGAMKFPKSTFQLKKIPTGKLEKSSY